MKQDRKPSDLQGWLNQRANQICVDGSWQGWGRGLFSDEDQRFFAKTHEWAVAVARSFERGGKLHAENVADVAQEVAIKVQRFFGTFHRDGQEAQYSTWLHRVVMNACLDATGRRARRSEIEITEENTNAVEMALQKRRGRKDEIQLENTEFTQKMLAPLSSVEREMLLMQADGDTAKQIAEHFGITVSAARAKMFRAIHRCRSWVEGQQIGGRRRRESAHIPQGGVRRVG